MSITHDQTAEGSRADSGKCRLRTTNETLEFVEFIYDYIDEFKLIVCKSAGTRFETFIHDISILKEETALRYMDVIRSKGVLLNDFDKSELHLLVTNNVNAVLETVRHDFTRDEAVHYARTLDGFYQPVWKKYFGL